MNNNKTAAPNQQQDNKNLLEEYTRLRELGVPIPLRWIQALSPISNSIDDV